MQCIRCRGIILTHLLRTRAANKVVRHLYTDCISTVTRVSKHLTLYKPVDHVVERGQPQTLALLFPCLWTSNAKIQRYCNLYMDWGVSVLCVNTSLRQLLWPPATKSISKELLGYLATNETPLSTYQFLVHTISSGSYIYATMLMEIFESESRYGFIESKIRGQVFDSFVYGGRQRFVDSLATVTPNPIASGIIRGLAQTYLLLAGSQVQIFYEKALQFIETGPIHSQVLFYHSLNDAVCDSIAFHKLIDDWSRKESMNIHVKCWRQSRHAQHLWEHPREYLRTLQSYLESVQVHEKREQIHAVTPKVMA